MSEIIETYEVELDNGYKISKPDGERWAITKQGIFWDITEDENLPHQDHVEMSGHKVSAIVRYRVDNDRRLTLTCDLIWPTLRTKEGEVRAYLTRTYDLLAVPFLINGNAWIPGPVSSIFFNGNLTIVFDNAENDVAVLLSIGEQELEVLFSFSSEEQRANYRAGRKNRRTGFRRLWYISHYYRLEKNYSPFHRDTRHDWSLSRRPTGNRGKSCPQYRFSPASWFFETNARTDCSLGNAGRGIECGVRFR